MFGHVARRAGVGHLFATWGKACLAVGVAALVQCALLNTTVRAAEESDTKPAPAAAPAAPPTTETPAAPLTATPPPAAAPPPVVENPVAIQIRRKISSGSQRSDAAPEDWSGLAAYYSEHQGSPVWVTTRGISERGKSAMAEIRKADDWGLSARDFVLPQAISGDATPSALADAEIKIALAVLKYARQARGGRFKPLQLSPDLDQTPNIRDPKRVLREITAAETADSYLRSLHPKNPQFKMLREALLRARGRSNKAEYVAPPPRPIRSARSDAYPGDERSGAYVPWQDRGNGEDAAPNDDDYDPDDNPDRRAPQPQAREPIPGSNDDVRRIIVNMERWRWMPDELGAFYVWDNVPEFTTRVMKNGKIIHDDKIIVGKRNTPTTVFSAKMQYIVFHPEWAVPDSIKVNEIQPYLRFEPGFLGIGGGMDTSILQQQNLRVVYNGNQIDPSRIDWRKVDIRQFQFLQAPGDKNVLGTLKFRFPNKHDIYMHDTPERALFSRSMRALSHGCMRVQNPQRLAEVLLAEDKGWPTSEISARLEHGYNTEVELSRKIPVHITYFTAVAGEGGKVQFFGDIYGYDTMMASALDGRPLRSAVQYPDEPEVSAATRRSSSSRQAGGLDNFFSILLGF